MKPPINLELFRELQGTACRCGSHKDRDNSFCRACYFALPDILRKVLYRRFGQGYEEAYAEAVGYLRKTGRVK